MYLRLIDLVVGVGIEPTFRVFQTRANPSQLSDLETSPIAMPILDRRFETLRRNLSRLNDSQVRKGGLPPLAGRGQTILNKGNQRGQAALPNLRGFVGYVSRITRPVFHAAPSPSLHDHRARP